MSGKTLLIKKFDKIEYTLVELDGKLLLGINYRRNKYDTLNEVRGPYKYLEELAEDLRTTDYPEREKFIWIINVKPDLAEWSHPKKIVSRTWIGRIKLEIRKEYRCYTLLIDNIPSISSSSLEQLLDAIRMDPSLRKFYNPLKKVLRVIESEV